MPDLPKQELDELFREGAGMQNFEYNEAAWNKMEAKLDADDQKRNRGVWFFLLLGVAIVLIAGLWYAIGDHAYTAQNQELADQEIQNKMVNTTTEESGLIQSLEVEKDIESTTTIEKKITQLNTSLSSVNDKTQFTSNNKKSTDLNVLSNPSIAFVQPINTPAKNIETDNENADNSTYRVQLPNTEIFTQEEQERKKLANNVSSILQVAPIEDLNISTPIMITDRIIEGQTSFIATAVDNEEGQERSVMSKLSYSIYGAPEWSSIGVNGKRKMGYKFGTTIAYQIANHWEVSSGLSLSQKKFEGKGSQFTEAGGWKDDIMPMSMEAKCNIIEIPLDVVYHFAGVGNTGFVATAGLRSYMLHSEWYGFEYNPSQYKPDLMHEKNIPNQNKNWVGSLQLSLGYSKSVSNNLSVQIVPYVQIPITGIGDGKVNLYSGGVQFALRFDSK